MHPCFGRHSSLQPSAHFTIQANVLLARRHLLLCAPSRTTVLWPLASQLPPTPPGPASGHLACQQPLSKVHCEAVRHRISSARCCSSARGARGARGCGPGVPELRLGCSRRSSCMTHLIVKAHTDCIELGGPKMGTSLRRKGLISVCYNTPLLHPAAAVCRWQPPSPGLGTAVLSCWS